MENNNGVTVGMKRERGEENTQKNTTGGRRGESEKGAHIFTERERRKKMRNMFSTLHGLLPQLPPKADKSTIVDEAVKHIKSLQQTLHDLQQRKLQILQSPGSQKVPSVSFNDTVIINDDAAINDSYNAVINDGKVPSLLPLGFQTWTSANVILNIYGDEAQISICRPSSGNKIGGQGVFTAVCSVLEKYNIDVVTAHVASMSHRRTFMIQVRHRRPQEKVGAVEGGFAEATEVEGIYKDATNEIISYLSCCS